ncbi:MAG: hypothetical protein ACRCX8_08740 [Sarcina sp.]
MDRKKQYEEDEAYFKKYIKINEDVRKTISSDMVKVLGLENLLYAVIHALVCECIDNNDIKYENRREIITERINKVLDKWVN